MAGIGDTFTGAFSSLYNADMALNVLLFSIALAVVSLFIWKFYKSTSKVNLIELKLHRYNTSEHPLFSKLLATGLYLLEYIIIMPLLIMLWFSALSIVLLVIANQRTTDEILLIGAVLIGAIRILAYFNSEISKDLAKLFPFMILSVFLLGSGELDLNLALSRLNEIPVLLGSIFSFLLVLFGIEIVLRAFYAVFEFWRSEEGATESVVEEED